MKTLCYMKLNASYDKQPVNIAQNIALSTNSIVGARDAQFGARH